jgi:hypothetical protein
MTQAFSHACHVLLARLHHPTDSHHVHCVHPDQLSPHQVKLRALCVLLVQLNPSLVLLFVLIVWLVHTVTYLVV